MEQKQKKSKNWISIILRSMLMLLLVFLCIIALLHIPSIQRYISNQVISSLTKDLNGRLTLNRTSFDLNRGVEMGDLYLINESEDTLAHISSLSVTPQGTLISLISGELALNDIVLDGVAINLSRGPESPLYNWDELFQSKKEEDIEIAADTSTVTEGFKLPLDVKQIRITNASINLDDKWEGLSITSEFKSLDLDLEGQSDEVGFLNISRLVLNEPNIQVRVDEQSTSFVKDEAASGEGGGLPRFFINELSILNGDITFQEKNKTPEEVSDVDLLFSNLQFDDVQNWKTTVQDLSLNYGYEKLKYLGIKSLNRSGEKIEIVDLNVRLNQSRIELDGAITGIKDEFDFSNSQYRIKLDPSFLRLKEFYRIVPKLANEIGPDPISESRIQLSGDYFFSSNELEARDVSLWVDGDHHFEGNLSSELSDEPGRSIINAEVVEFKSNLELLDALSSKYALPDELKRLGNATFKGSYDGYANDFIANGSLITDLGEMDMDVQIDLSGEGDQALSYEGNVELVSFNMAGFMNNQDFGLVNAKLDITNGVGPNIADSEADIKATIQELNFKNYHYRDATYDGRLSSRIINGVFNIDDENVDLEFEGIVDVSGDVPLFDFKIIAETIDFCKLNLADFPCQVSFASDVSFRGNSLSTIEGRGLIGDIELKQDTSVLNIDNIELRSARIQRGMQLELKSDFVDFNIAGEFNLISLAQQSFDQFLTNVKTHNQTWKLKQLTAVDTKQDFSFAMYLKDASPLFAFLNQEIENSGKAIITGSLNTESDIVELDAYFPYVRYQDISSDTLQIALISSAAESKLEVDVSQLKRGSQTIKDAIIQGDFEGDTLVWRLKGNSLQDDIVDISGVSKAQEEGYFTSINKHEISVDSTQWYFLENRGFGIYPNRVDIDSFTLTDMNRSVSLDDQFDKHLQVTLNDFQLGFINPIIDYDKLDFSGSVDAQVVISDLFSNRSLTGRIGVADFEINGDDFGELQLDAVRADNGNVLLDLSIVKDTQQLLVNGLLDIDSSFVDAKIKLADYPMSFFEYIIDDGISETVGRIDVTADLFGNFNDLNLKGEGIVKDGGTRVDYLGAFYRMEDQRVKIDQDFIDLNNIVLIDEMGNEAVLKGGLTHNMLADIEAAVSISSPRFIGLNTTVDDNSLYYGLGVGALDITFDGPFDEIDIDVIATADNLSQLFIPISTTEYGVDESFIKFNYQPVQEDSTQASPLLDLLRSEGANFEMNLTFTQDAEVSVIYDENTSNVLRGRGEGALRINVTREGEFTIHGEYNVLSGNYLYTAYGAIAKPFTIQPGGTVRWTGDPINANLNVSAIYPGLRVPLSTFLAEFADLPGSDNFNLNQRQDVDLTLLLGGNLYQPTINFDIEFPNLTGPVKTLANSKLRTLKTSENAINNQVVGLMVFGNFLPDDNPLAQLSASSIGQTAGSTVSQFITTQLSAMLTDYLTSKLSQDGFITGIDLEIALAQNTGILNPNGVTNNFFEPDEVQVNLRNRIREGNVYLNVGGNYVRQGQLGNAQNYVTGDFSLEWFITDDKRLKLRFYSNFGYDEARTSGRQRYGLGINYRKEFGSITNFDAILQDLVDEVNEETSVK